jgi:hypothetical protein
MAVPFAIKRNCNAARTESNASVLLSARNVYQYYRKKIHDVYRRMKFSDATNRKVAGSIPDEVIFLNLPNPSGRTRPWGLLSL